MIVLFKHSPEDLIFYLYEMKVFLCIITITTILFSYAQDTDIFKTGITSFDVRVAYNGVSETQRKRFLNALDIKVRESYSKNFIYLAGDPNNIPNLIVIIDALKNGNVYAASVLFLDNDVNDSNLAEKLILDSQAVTAVDDEGELIYNISLILTAKLK